MLKNNKLIQGSLVTIFSFVNATFLLSAELSRAQEWSYGGYTNPTKWHELSDKFEVCESGNQQSPINIEEVNTSSENQGNIEFNYDPSNLEIVNDNHTVKVNYDSNSSVTINGKTYELKQYHFHTPSEHRFSDELAAMELHLVHQNDEGDYAVVGIMIESGQTHQEIAKVWSNIPEKGQTKDLTATANASNFLPDNRDYYQYNGSFTTPPCTEGVNWILMQTPIEASREQIDAFASLYPANHRPIQEQNNRRVMEYQD